MAADPLASAALEMIGCVKANESDVVLFLPGTSSEKTRTHSRTRRLEGDLPGSCREGFP